MTEPDPDDADGPELPGPEVIDVLVANHREFLAFVQRRTGDRGLAEQLVQDAFVKVLADPAQIRESAVGWFYRVLRNAVVDHHRRHAAATRTLEALAQELAAEPGAHAELHEAVCRCVGALAATLRPEYERALRRVELDGLPVKDYAVEAGITSNNAAVRLLRARGALRRQVARACGTCAEHGCYQCTCQRGR